MDEELRNAMKQLEESVERLKKSDKAADRAERIAKVTYGVTAVVVGAVIISTINKYN